MEHVRRRQECPVFITPQPSDQEGFADAALRVLAIGIPAPRHCRQFAKPMDWGCARALLEIRSTIVPCSLARAAP